jgi:hypothetical protein
VFRDIEHIMNNEGRHRPMGRQVPGASADAAGTHSAAT